MSKSNAKAKRALQRQREAINYLTAAGYSFAHAQRVARRWHPTPSQQNLEKARNARRERRSV